MEIWRSKDLAFICRTSGNTPTGANEWLKWMIPPQTFQMSLCTDYLLSSPTLFGPLWIHTRLGGFQELDCVAHKELPSWRCSLCCSCSVAQTCPTLCDPMDWSTSAFPVLHYLLEFAQTHVYWIDDTIQPTVSSSVAPFSSCLQSFPASGSFLMNRPLASGGQSIGASASVSVLLVNISGWFLLRLAGLISTHLLMC